MAEFCRQCAAQLGQPTDLAGLCAPGYIVPVLCEGCGPTYVDHAGQCISDEIKGKAAKVGFMVWSPDVSGTIYIYTTYEEALKEGERLTKLWPNCRFVVLTPMAIAFIPKVD